MVIIRGHIISILEIIKKDSTTDQNYDYNNDTDVNNDSVAQSANSV